MSILKSIETSFEDKKRKGWDKMYYFFDIHSTIVKPNYKAGDIPTEFYPHAKETLQYLSTVGEISMGLYTCSHPHEIEKYKEFFTSHNINFSFVNKNPEIVTDPIGYGCYDDKPYINVLFDDKAGFDGETDWLPVLLLMKKKCEGITEEDLNEEDQDQLFCEIENEGLGYWLLNYSLEWEAKNNEMGILIREARKSLSKLEKYFESKGIME